MYSQQELDDAVASGVITADAANALRAHIDAQRSTAIPDGLTAGNRGPPIRPMVCSSMRHSGHDGRFGRSSGDCPSSADAPHVSAKPRAVRLAVVAR